MVLDGLDEAQAPRDIARRLLVPLARDLGVKVLTGTRPGRDGELLAALGKQAVAYRLDEPPWFEPQNLADYAVACLRADFDPALPSRYRTDSTTCGQVAEAIAAAAGSNFLVAGLAARARADEPVIDVSAPGWQQAERFPAEVGQAFDDYLSRFGDKEGLARDLLRAAAYASGDGLPADVLWADMASALATPRRYGIDDLAWLLDSAAAYLIESGEPHGYPTYRVFHQALIDHLRRPDKEYRSQRRIASTLIAVVPRTAEGPDWARAPSYILDHLAAHAAAGGLLDELLDDPGFLVAAHPSGLLPVLDSASSPQARQIAWFYRTAADRVRTDDVAERAAHLQHAAGKAGLRQMADALGAAAASWPCSTRVLSWRSPARYTALGSMGRFGPSATVTAQGDVLALDCGDDGTLALWRLGEDGLVPVGHPQPAHTGRHGVRKVAFGQLDGETVAVTAGYHGALALWRVGEDGLVPVGRPQPGHDPGVAAAAVGQLGSQSVAVTVGDDGTVALWRLGEDGLVPVGDRQPGHSSDYNLAAVAVGQLDSQAVAITSGSDGMVALWRLGEDGLTPIGDPQPGRGGFVRDVAIGQLDSQTMAITSGSNGTLALWRLGKDGLTPIGDLQRAQADDIVGGVAVAIGQLGSQTVAVTGGGDGAVTVWRVGKDGLTPIGDPQHAHRGFLGVEAVAIGQLASQAVAVTSGYDGTVVLWRLGEEAPPLIGDPQPAHPGLLGVEAVAIGQLASQTVAVTVKDGMAALWRLGEDGLALIGDPQRSYSTDPRAGRVAVGQLGSQTIAVTFARDGTLALWRVSEDGLTPIGDPQRGPPGSDMSAAPAGAVAIGQLTSQTIAVTFADGGTLALWRVGEDGLALIDSQRGGYRGDMGGTGVAIGQLGSQTMAVTCGGAGTVALWRLGQDGLALIGESQHGKGGPIDEVAVGQIDSQSVAITGGVAGTVALWRLGQDGLALIGDPQPAHPGLLGVEAVAIGQLGSQTVAVTGGHDGTVALWRRGPDGLIRAPITHVPVGSPLISIALFPPAAMLLWCSDGVLVTEMRNSRAPRSPSLSDSRET